MIQEALQYLANLATESQRAEFGVRDDRYVIVKRTGGEVSWVAGPPRPRSIDIDSFGSFIEACKHYSAQAVFHCAEQCIAVLDDGETSDRLDVINFTLAKSGVACVAESLNRGETLSQREFISLLRHELYGCVPETILPAVRKMDASSHGRGVSEVQAGRERGTREFVAELANASEIPEVFPITFYCCESLTSITSVSVVHCTLSYTLPPADVKFTVRTIPGELDRAVAKVQEELGEALRGELQGIPVFYGSP